MMASVNVNLNSQIVNPLLRKENLVCPMTAEEKKLLFRKANFISRYVRKTFFFPLSPARMSSSSANSCSKMFWETSFVDLDYPKKKQIQDHFNRYEQIVEIEVEGKKLELKTLVIESKDIKKSDKQPYNHLIVQGNTSNLENNTPGVYPFLESYMKEKEKDEAVNPARFVIFNHYDNFLTDHEGKKSTYLPATMDEWGFLFKKTIETFSHSYGRFNAMSAHSLGNMPMIAQLKHFSESDFKTLFPTTLFLSKGPSSLYEVSKNVPFELGIYPFGWLFLISPILYFFAKCLGWSLELDETLLKYFQNLPKTEENLKKLKETTIILTEVKHDYYFPKKASLPSSQKMKDLEKEPINLYRLSFNPPGNRTVRKGQHNYYLNGFQRRYLYKEELSLIGKKILELKDQKKIFDAQLTQNLFLSHGMSISDLILKNCINLKT